MPEGPELYLSSQFINSVCKGHVFTGKVRKNPIHKCADIVWNAATYTVSSVSRGKEMQVFLQAIKSEKDNPKAKAKQDDTKLQQTSIRISFGMSGKFMFTSVAELPKHAHLAFFTKTEPQMALSFVDPRRFGKWHQDVGWLPTRGPCIMNEYSLFRSNVLSNLSNPAFNRPLCEALLNQKYFNGVGNYLRAEICYRAGVRPFEQARSVFAALLDASEQEALNAKMKPKTKNQKVKDTKVTDDKEEVKDTKVLLATKNKKAGNKKPDILELCHSVPLEVIGLGTSMYVPEVDRNDTSRFSKWLQCYCKPGMKNIPDHNQRTMWYESDPGPMVPVVEGGAKSRNPYYYQKLMEQAKDAEEKSPKSKVKATAKKAQQPKAAGKRKLAQEEEETSEIKGEETSESEEEKTTVKAKRPKATAKQKQAQPQEAEGKKATKAADKTKAIKAVKSPAKAKVTGKKLAESSTEQAAKVPAKKQKKK